MNIGGLYTYRHSRRLHRTKELNEWFAEFDEDTPLVLLEVYNLPASFSEVRVIKAYKVLTSTGIIGWMIGAKEYFHELS